MLAHKHLKSLVDQRDTWHALVIEMDAPGLSHWLVAFICERSVAMVMFGLQEYVRKATQQLRDFAKDVVVAWGMYLFSKIERKILQSKVNVDDDPFSGQLACGVMSRTVKTVEVPYYISQRATSFRIFVVMFLCDTLGIDPLGEVTLEGLHSSGASHGSLQM